MLSPYHVELLCEVERLCSAASALKIHRDVWRHDDPVNRAYDAVMKELEAACRKLNEFWSKGKSA